METIAITEDELEQALIDYFSEPDLSDCFTIVMLEEKTGQTRGQLRPKVEAGIDRGEIEFVMNYKNTNYYRLVGKNGNNEA